MQLRRAAVGMAVVAMVVLAGCDWGRGQDGGGGGGQAAADGAATEAPAAPAADEAAPTRGQAAAAPGKAGSTEAAAQVRLVDLGNRIVRAATVDLEVGKGQLDETIDKASDVVVKAKGIYVGSSTSVPSGEPASGQVTFRVPVDAFEPVLRELKGLGTYRGEQSSTEDVTNQYVDLNAQLAAWRAQERVYLRLLDRARSVADVIAVQNQLQQVQSNIERLQGQLDQLEDRSSFSTITLQLSEPGAAAGEPPGRLARAWATAVNGLG
jgi:virulence-associated protein VapD